MDPNNKGLADSQDGEFILNESGTSVSIDSPEEEEQADEMAEKAKIGSDDKRDIDEDGE